MFIDTHCHLFYEDFKNDIADVIKRANDVGVNAFVVPATNHETAKEAIQLAERFSNFFVCVGFHPLDLKEYSEENFKVIEELASHPKVVAIGEIGIDYFYDTSPRDFQKEIFTLQIEFAVRKNLPIVVHTRDSVQDAIDIAVQYSKKHPQWKKEGKRGVFHCFTGDAQQAQTLFENNFLVSYPGPVTFKKSTMPQVVKEIGIENIMLETDSPFLTPVPYRGKRNEPSYIPLIAQKISEIMNVLIEEVAKKTTANAKDLFNLPLK
jgi:TatD DNase family protein